MKILLGLLLAIVTVAWGMDVLATGGSNGGTQVVARDAHQVVADHARIVGRILLGSDLGVDRRQALRDRAIALLEQLPPEHNTVLAQWTERGVQVDSAARGQALLELQHQYCTPRRCLSCGFGRHLLRCTRP